MNFILILLIPIISLIGIASRLFLGFCVYYDAKYRKNENAVLWGVLSGFFGIAALVYIIIQVSSKQKVMRCLQCGEFIAPDGICCPRCGRILNVPTPEMMQSYNHKRKLFLGLWIATIALVMIVVAVFVCMMVMQAVNQVPHRIYR